MQDKNKSAVDLITEIHNMLQRQGAEIAHLQKAMSTIGAKVNGVLFGGEPIEVATAVVQNSTTLVDREPELVVDRVAEPKPDTSAQRNTRVYGSVKKEGKGIPGVDVSITDATNKIIKQTRTNAAGQWICFLPSGSYTAEFTAPGKRSEVREIIIRDGQRELEIK